MSEPEAGTVLSPLLIRKMSKALHSGMISFLEDDMARKRTIPLDVPTITFERAARLGRLLHYLKGGKTRAQILRKLQTDVRAFYRDLELLRSVGIEVQLEKGKYALKESTEEAIKRLPLPDPHLTVGDAEQLSKGRTAAHRKLKAYVEKVTAEN